MVFNYPLGFQLEVTEFCNHRCFYCYNSSTLKPRSELSLEKADELSDIVIADIQPFFATLTGGEPLLNLDTTLFLMEKFKKNYIKTSINTNLTLLDNDMLQKFTGRFPKNDLHFLASLPHYQKEMFNKITDTDNLETFYSNLENLVKNDIYPSINMVVNALNHKDVYNEGKFLIENFKIKNFCATPVVSPACYKDSINYHNLSTEDIVAAFEDLIRLKEDYNIGIDILEVIPRCIIPQELYGKEHKLFDRQCSAGRAGITVSVTGDVRPCTHSPLNMGNIFEEKFKTIWERMAPYRNNEYIPSVCNGCVEAKTCRGGCRFNGCSDSCPNKPDPMMKGKMDAKLHFEEENKKISLDTDYIVNTKAVFRSEDENLFTFYNGDSSSTISINTEFKELYLTLMQLGSFVPSDLLDKMETESQKKALLPILNMLFINNYIYEKRR